MDNPDNLTLIRHPLLADKLARLRDRNTQPQDFRLLLVQIATLMTYEACRHFETTARSVETPLERTTVEILRREITVVPILRAGLGMIDGILSVIPEAKIGFMGLYRDEVTLKPIDYYKNLPAKLDEMEVMLVDPLLATGGSASSAAGTLKKFGAKRLFMLSIICTPQGVNLMEQKHPDVKIYSAALDRELNDKAYVLPGVGDVGDRCFGT